MGNGQLKFAPSESLHQHQMREVVMTSFVWVAATIVFGTLAWILFEIMGQGISQLSWTFLTAEVEDAGRRGGIGPIILSTTLILIVTLAIALHLSLATAIALTEKPDQNTAFTRTVRHSLDILAGVPSIVFGLFGNAFFAIVLGLGYSILTGGLTLACMILPLLIRATEQSILAVPNDYRYAAALPWFGPNGDAVSSGVTSRDARFGRGDCSECGKSFGGNCRVDFYRRLCIAISGIFDGFRPFA